MNRLEAEAVIDARRQTEGRNFEKDHSLDECVGRLQQTPSPHVIDEVSTALNELRRISEFPPHIEAKASDNLADDNHQVTVYWVSGGVGQHRKGATLSEAMAKVRELKEAQHG